MGPALEQAAQEREQHLWSPSVGVAGEPSRGKGQGLLRTKACTPSPTCPRSPCLQHGGEPGPWRHRVRRLTPGG